MTEPDRSRKDVDRSNGRKSRARSGLLFALGILVATGVSVFFFLSWMSRQVVREAKEEMADLINVFQPDLVVETFEEWREMKATGTEGNILEIATAEATEKFSRKTAVALFGKHLPLGTTVSEIVVPATYRYHIDLNGRWFLTADGNRLLVLAPRVQPSLPVAFDTGKMEKKTKSGWARWDGDENLEALEKTVTSKLAQRSTKEDALEKAREAGREGVARFVRSWLISRDAWGETKFDEIVVRFEGEEGSSLSTMPPALDLEGEKAGAEVREPPIAP